MNIENLLDEIDNEIEKAWSIMSGRYVVKGDRIKTLIEDIRINMPQEIKEAKAIAADRANIIAAARREADAILTKAQEQAKMLVARDEIVRQAQTTANDILSQTQIKSKDMRRAASEFADDMLGRSEEVLTQNLQELRKVRHGLKHPKKPSVE